MPFDGGPRSQTVEYEPVGVKDLLIEMKDTSELIVDIAYSALLHNSADLATETGVSVIAIHRAGDEWVFYPDEAADVGDDDVLIVRGTWNATEQLLDDARLEAA